MAAAVGVGDHCMRVVDTSGIAGTTATVDGGVIAAAAANAIAELGMQCGGGPA